jgi:hypothetical protein
MRPRRREYALIACAVLLALSRANQGPVSKAEAHAPQVAPQEMHHPCATWIRQSGGGTPERFACVNAWRE